MKIFKLIDINVEAERDRISKVIDFTDKQRLVLHDLCDMFEAGEWQKCLDHINNEEIFPYNEEGEYDEKEHIGFELGNILRQLGYEVFYTLKQLDEQLNEKV